MYPDVASQANYGPQNAKGYDVLRPVESTAIDSIGERTKHQLSIAQETESTLETLSTRLFGPRPPSVAGATGNGDRQLSTGAFDAIRDAQSELTIRMTRIDALAREINART